MVLLVSGQTIVAVRVVPQVASGITIVAVHVVQLPAVVQAAGRTAVQLLAAVRVAQLLAAVQVVARVVQQKLVAAKPHVAGPVVLLAVRGNRQPMHNY